MTYIKTSLTKKEVDIFFKTIFKSNFFYFIFGIFIAFFSSLPVIDVESGFWLNDESKFYLWAKNDIVGLDQGLLTTLRYSFFTSILKLYFIFLNDPFYIVFIHKVLVIGIYVFILGGVINRYYDYRVFIIIFILLNYLNLFFLRDSLIALFGLSYLILSHNKFKLKNYFKTEHFKILNFLFHMTSIFFLRAQIIFFYIKPIFSIPLFFLSSSLILSLYLYDIGLFYKVINITILENLNFLKTINDYILVTIISLNIVIFFYLIVVNYKKYNLIILRVYKYLIFFIILITIIYFVFILNFYIKYFGVSFEQLIKQDLYNFIKVILVSVNNINPFNKFPFYLSNNNFLHLSFGTISCLVLILFIIQVLIGNLINHLNFSKSKNILVGLIMIFIIYGFSKTYIDVRIIISALLPFFLFIDFRFFNLKGYFLATIGTLFASLLNFFIF